MTDAGNGNGSASLQAAPLLQGPQWLKGYNVGWLRGDVIAGITLAAYLLPSALGDASLAGLPPQAGLYAVLFSGLVFWIFCSSRHTAISVTSALSLLIGASLGPLAGGDPVRFWALAACTALLVSVLAFLAWVVRAGVIVNFISETVLIGFKTGVALVLISTQLPKLFGISGSHHGDFWERMGEFFAHVNETHPLSLLLGLGALALLIGGKVFLKNKPVAVFVVIGGIIVASAANLGEQGVKLLGEVPQGLPAIGFPAVHWSDINELLPLAIACFLLGAVETVAIGRMFALKHGYRFEANQEFLGLAGANLASGLGQGFPVGGGMSQSLVNESGGARSPLSTLVSALIILIVTLFLSDLLKDLPQPVLAAIVLMAVAGLFKIEPLMQLWKFSRGEFAVAMVALMGVLGSGILRGVMIGALLSIILLLHRASRPHAAVLGRVPGTDFFGDLDRDPENEEIPGVMIFRADASIVYFNAEYIRDQFESHLRQQAAPVKLVVWCLGSTVYADLAGVEMLAHLHGDLAKRGIALKLAEMHGPLRKILRAGGLEKEFGTIESNRTIVSVIREWQASGASKG